MKFSILYIALCVLFVDLINAKSITLDTLRERRGADKPKPKPKAAPGPKPARGPGPVRGPLPGRIAPPIPGQMPGPIPGQIQGGGAMGGPECGGCAQSQEPKQCPAVCMRWSTIIKPNGQIENGPASITPLSPNEKVGTNGVFPPMNSVSPMIAGAGVPIQGIPAPGAPAPGGQPPQGPPPAEKGTTAPPKREKTGRL